LFVYLGERFNFASNKDLIQVDSFFFASLKGKSWNTKLGLKELTYEKNHSVTGAYMHRVYIS